MSHHKGLLPLLLLRFALRALGRPNIVFILTDDLDVRLGGLSPLEKTRRLVGDEGCTFVNAFATSPICCPSRSSILTGLYQHSHGTVNNSIEGGCSSRNWQEAHEPNTFGAILHRSGYKTFYAGKYLNKYGYKISGGVKHVPEGWDWWISLVGNSAYYDYSLSVNGSEVKKGNDESDYLTDVLRDYSLMFLNQQRMGDPFLMVVSTPSPHEPFTPARRHAGMFSGAKAPRTPNFNRLLKGTKHWLLGLPPDVLPPEVIDRIDEVFQKRWETLLAVDELVEALVSRLSQLKLLNDTFIAFSSDHGFHLGQFAQPWDKRQPYETDIRIPMLVRGPGVLTNKAENPVLNIDLAPFFLDIAGIEPTRQMDGESFLPCLAQSTQSTLSRSARSRAFLVEYAGESDRKGNECYDDANLKHCTPDTSCKCLDARNNSYGCVRRLGAEADDIFCEFEDDDKFQECYDISRDPYQMNNLCNFPGTRISQLVLDCCNKNIRLRKSIEACLKGFSHLSEPEIIYLT